MAAEDAGGGSGRARAVLRALALGVAAWLLIGAHVAGRVSDARFEDWESMRRVWEDQAAAISSFLDAAHPVRPENAHRIRADMRATTRRVLPERVDREGVRPWQFWRTVRVEPFLRDRGRADVGPSDDTGRATLLAAGYRLLGGIAPFLIVWVGWLAAAPAVVWLVAEIAALGRTRAALAATALLATSPFVADACAMVRSSAGYYVLAVIGLAAYAAGMAGARLTVRGYLVRTLAAGALLAAYTVCRGSTLLLLPGFALAAARGAWRLPPSGSARRALAWTGAATALLLLMLVPARGRTRHDVWVAQWEGLGDFDREKGFAWSDPIALDLMRAHGLAPDLKSDAAEAFFRPRVIGAVRDDPAWYAGILARRLAATVLQTRLWPWRPLHGESVAPNTSPNEGFIRKYYGYLTPIDYVGFAGPAFELPAQLLPLAGLGLLGAAAWGWPAAREGVAALGCVAAGAIVLPVAGTTAGGIETQAFALVYLLAPAYLAESSAMRRRATG